MIEEQIIDVDSEVVVEEEQELPIETVAELPLKTKEQREYERNQLKFLKQLMKKKRRYYKSNLFAIRSMNAQ
jgi:hypothetical protein